VSIESACNFLLVISRLVTLVLSRTVFENDKIIGLGSDRRPETKQGIEGKLLGSDREGLGIGLGIRIRIADVNQIADLILTPCFRDIDTNPMSGNDQFVVVNPESRLIVE